MPIDFSPLKPNETFDQYLQRIGVPKGGYTSADTQRITSANLAPPSTDFSTGIQTPSFPAPSQVTIPKLELTPGQQQESEINKQLREINLSLTGAPAFRQTQEQAQDIESKTRAIQDFQNQLFQIQGEQAALKAREAAISPSLDLQLQRGGPGAFQTEFTRGRQEEKARRELAIEGLAVSARAATTSALFQAAQGNLATAQGLVDKAVRDKFATQEAQRDALLANLQLVKTDPESTRQEKNEALRVETLLSRQKEQDSQNKENFKRNFDLALKVAGQVDAVTLNKILEAKDAQGNYSPTEALRIANESGALKEKRTTATREIGGREVLYDTQTGEVIKDLGPAKGVAAEKPLSILDVQRYQELYPEAGIVAGDTEAQANVKVGAINTPEAKTRSLIVAAKDNGNDYETVVNEINNDTTIKDKEISIKIAQEVYGISEEVSPDIFGRGNFANIKIDDRITQLKETQGNLATKEYIREQLVKDGYPANEVKKRTDNFFDKFEGFIGSIFNSLFGK